MFVRRLDASGANRGVSAEGGDGLHGQRVTSPRGESPFGEELLRFVSCLGWFCGLVLEAALILLIWKKKNFIASLVQP